MNNRYNIALWNTACTNCSHQKPLVKSTIFTVLSEVVASFIKALHGLGFLDDFLVSVNVSFVLFFNFFDFLNLGIWFYEDKKIWKKNLKKSKTSTPAHDSIYLTELVVIILGWRCCQNALLLGVCSPTTYKCIVPSYATVLYKRVPTAFHIKKKLY